jgi:hypothetical protein
MNVKNFGQWEYYPGNELYSLALPDYHSTYLSYTIDMKRHAGMGLRISGAFPKARYMSFNAYSTRAGTSLAALTDYEIVTSNDSADNPFIAGSTAAFGGQYVVNVQPDDDNGPKLKNVLNFDPQQLTDGELTVILRYYMPQPNNFGSVDHPQIDIYPLIDPKKTTKAPDGIRTNMDSPLHKATYTSRMRPIFQTASGDTLRFYHVAGGGEFNNADNIYLIAAVKDVDGVNNCVVLRVKPPTFPQSSEQLDQVMVRFWSFNQGNPDTSTPFGMPDQQLFQSWDGYVYIVMGGESVQAKAEHNGYNYMPWLSNDREAVIIYRNMLTVPQFRSSIEKVPELPAGPWSEPVLEEHEASRFIGDAAPAGRVVPVAKFNAAPNDIFK